MTAKFLTLSWLEGGVSIVRWVRGSGRLTFGRGLHLGACSLGLRRGRNGSRRGAPLRRGWLGPGARSAQRVEGDCGGRRTTCQPLFRWVRTTEPMVVVEVCLSVEGGVHKVRGGCHGR